MLADVIFSCLDLRAGFNKQTLRLFVMDQIKQVVIAVLLGELTGRRLAC